MTSSPFLTLRQLGARFDRFKEPTDMAYEVSAEIEHVLNKRGLKNLPLADMARAIENRIAAYNKHYSAMENALSACCQLALIHGANEEEMRSIGTRVEEGDKP